MFSQLFFIILVLLIVNLAPEHAPAYWGLTSKEVASFASFGYVFTLALILLQNLLFHPKPRKLYGFFLILTNIELVTCLTAIHFILGGHTQYPLARFETTQAVVTLALYFFGMVLFHLTANYERTWRDKLKYAADQFRFLTPFVIPFLFFSFVADLLSIVPDETYRNWFGDSVDLFLLVVTLVILLATMIYLPFLVQLIWKCAPIKDSELKERLESVCRKAGFKHGGMMMWTVMNRSLTAAIIGVFHKYRYIMFTKRLVDVLSPEEIEAVLAHEIGHSQRKHLILYPFVILGMMVTAALFFSFLSKPMEAYFDALELSPSLAQLLHPLYFFIPYAILIALYFRFVFGYFSRLFERQADLHVFKVGIPASNLISALDHIGLASGNIHRHPSWHHYSIQERIDFIQKALLQPAVIKKHHRKVMINVIIYFILLGALGSLLFF